MFMAWSCNCQACSQLQQSHLASVLVAISLVIESKLGRVQQRPDQFLGGGGFVLFARLAR